MELNIIDTFDSEKELHLHYPNDKKYSTKDLLNIGLHFSKIILN